jgi:hypothetical protein
MNAYFALWKILKYKKEYRMLLLFSHFMIKNAHDHEVTFGDWLKSYILYSNALYYNNRYDDAIELLRSLLDIFSNIPIEEIKYLTEIYKTNKVSTTNNLVNFDKALGFYNKYHVYKKCEAIFLFTSKFKGRHFSFNINYYNERIIERERNKSCPFMGGSKPHDPLGRMSINGIEFENSTGGNNHEDNKTLNEDYNKYTGMLFNINKHDYDSYDIAIENIDITTVEGLEQYIEAYIDKINVSESNLCKSTFNDFSCDYTIKSYYVTPDW